MLRLLSTVDPSSRDSLPPAGIDPLAQLASAASAGDASATQTLVVSVAPALLRVVRSVLGAQHPDVEDVVQEAAFGFVDALPRFRRECTVLHFACRIGVLSALKARRQQRARGEANADRTNIDFEPDDGASPDDLAFFASRRQLLRSLCETLPDAQAETLLMHFILGFSVDEIAHATRSAFETVRSRLRLAKASLRARIEADPTLRDAFEVVS